MSDLAGKLIFDLEHVTHQTSSGSYYDQIIIRLMQSGSISSVLSDYMAHTKQDYAQLDYFYNAVLGGGQELTHGSDYAGTGYFKEAIQMFYYTSYMGILSDADRDAVAASAESGDWILRYKVTVSSSVFPYVYEFYRLDDRRVAVRLYQERLNGTPVGEPVADFYISTYAFKRFASAYVALANAQVIDPDEYGYGS